MLRYYIAKRKHQLILATVLSSVSAFLSILLLAYLNSVAGTGLSENYTRPVLIGLGLVVLMFISSAISQTYLAKFGASTIADLRRNLSEQFLKLDYEGLIKIGKSQVTGSLITDVTRVATLFMVLPMFFFNLLTVLFCFGYLLYLSWSLFLIFGAFMAVAIFSCLYLMSKSGQNFVAIRDEEDKLFEYFRGISEGKKELSLNRARSSHYLNDVIQKTIDRTWALGYQAQKWWNYGGTWSITMIFGAMFSIIYLGMGWLGIKQVLILQFVLVTLFLMNPLNYLIVASQDIAIGFSSVRKLSKIGIHTATRNNTDSTTQPIRNWETLSLDDVEYRYNKDDPHGFHLGPLDFRIKKGETVFIIGGNGSGKTTFSYLLTGLLTPDGGTICLDGHPIPRERLEDYRQLFSSVFFDFYLFHHVIDREGRLADDNLIRGFLEKLDLGEKVSSASGALSTTDLSQGQRKRLALLQSYVDNSEIFLFDEWAADQDPEFKEYFYYQLLPEFKKRGKTVISITHDEKYFDVADRLVKLDQGQILAHQGSENDNIAETA